MKKILNNRVINSTLLVINLVSAVITLYSFWQSFFDKRFTIILLTLCVIGILYAISYFVSQAFMPETKNTIELADNFHHVIDSYKDITLELRDRFEVGETVSEYEEVRVMKTQGILSRYNDLLKEAGIKKAQISLKLFRPDCDTELYTYCRGNAFARNVIEKDHAERIPIEKCTSFHGIMNREYERYFVGNNLIKDYDERKYFDYRGRPKYSSALIVPVRAIRSSEEDESLYYDVVGFICINSKVKDQFREDNPMSKIIIECTRAIADCMYVLITETQLYRDALNASEVNNGAISV